MTSLNRQFQLSDETRPDRFPKILNLAQRSHPNAKRVLSFGCSHGDECFALAKLFPEAEIIGADISKNVIRSAVRRRNELGLKNVLFTSNLPPGQFDVVTALMVFFSIYEPIPKDQFYAGVNELAEERVAPGGVILFHGLEFPFENPRFAPIRTWEHENNRKLVPGHKYYGGAFRRINYV